MEKTMVLLYSTSENEFDAINAVMAPDHQMKEKSLKGEEIEVCGIYQNYVENQNGEECVSTTLVATDGTTYQTLSDYVDRLMHAVAQRRPVDEWKSAPITIRIEWRESNNGREMLAPKLVKM